jgi:diadenosine tetraphosphatase ApaH/serine/threonine PP2A family protein phosphatase
LKASCHNACVLDRSYNNIWRERLAASGEEGRPCSLAATATPNSRASAWPSRPDGQGREKRSPELKARWGRVCLPLYHVSVSPVDQYTVVLRRSLHLFPLCSVKSPRRNDGASNQTLVHRQLRFPVSSRATSRMRRCTEPILLAAGHLVAPASHIYIVQAEDGPLVTRSCCDHKPRRCIVMTPRISARNDNTSYAVQYYNCWKMPDDDAATREAAGQRATRRTTPLTARLRAAGRSLWTDYLIYSIIASSYAALQPKAHRPDMPARRRRLLAGPSVGWTPMSGARPSLYGRVAAGCVFCSLRAGDAGRGHHSWR